ncbi:MAG: hypothetical protein DSZ28_03755 [Thiothrix sp.]|nr:MAG: hypothetical protein DSZ28_03755 [Thiothrix sp.]
MLIVLATTMAVAKEITVGTDPDHNILDLNNALGDAVSGDTIVLKAGTYRLNNELDNLLGIGLENVIIRGEDPSNPPIIDGDGVGRVFLLRRPKNVTLENLVIQNMTEGGLNIDDADIDTGEPPESWLPTLNHNITLRNITIRDIGTDSGNIDGLKLSGLNEFHIINLQVINWGDGGSAIDMVGCHNGVIENSFFHSDHKNVLTTGLVHKGGSETITIKNSRFELPKGFGSAVKLGGSTSDGLFRFKAGDSGYEAKDINVENNTVIHGKSAFSFVNIDGGRVQSNTIYQPSDWILRILNEAAGEGNDFPTRNGEFLDNTIIFDNGLEEAINIDETNTTEPETFVFARNQWFNSDDASASTPVLPSTEAEGIYGENPGFDPGKPTTATANDADSKPTESEASKPSGSGGGSLSIALLVFFIGWFLMRHFFRPHHFRLYFFSQSQCRNRINVLKLRKTG